VRKSERALPERSLGTVTVTDTAVAVAVAVTLRTQAVQPVCPFVLRPDAQGEQEVDPAFAETVPTAQRVHAAAPAAEKVPAGQAVQDTDPRSLANLPAEQLEQGAVPAVEKEPTEQAELETQAV